MTRRVPQISSEGLGVGQFSMPHGMCVDSRCNIYFAEVPWGQFGSKMDP
ncbi:MAG: hypothetical protein OTJ97_02875 [SAR202 cluster bacterium]|nr:hypothetical protein [SAR202 cluster bacterium]